MQNIGNVSILGMFTMYFFTAIFGYLTFFGEYILSTVTLNTGGDCFYNPDEKALN